MNVSKQASGFKFEKLFLQMWFSVIILTPKTQRTMCSWKTFNSGDVQEYNKHTNTVNTINILVKRFSIDLTVLIAIFSSSINLPNSF